MKTDLLELSEKCNEIILSLIPEKLWLTDVGLSA